MKHIAGHLKQAMHKSSATERGELMEYFRSRLNRDRIKDGYPAITMARLGHMLAKIPTKDLYYLKSTCDDAPHFSKKFWWLLNPKKHTNEISDTPSSTKKDRERGRK